MDKQKGIEILEKILERAKNYEYLWKDNPSPIQQSASKSFYFKEENKLNVLAITSDYSYSGMSGAYISIGKSKYALNRDFGYWFDGRHFFPEETPQAQSPEQVYCFLEKIRRGEKNIEEVVSKDIESIEKNFNKRIDLALEFYNSNEEAKSSS
jgi:hypothetical protein